MNKRTIALGAVTFLLLGPALPAKADSHWPCPEDVWRLGAGCFELWAECTRFYPFVSVDQEEATEKIDEEAVEDAVRSRVRAANLFARPLDENQYWINKKKGIIGTLDNRPQTEYSLRRNGDNLYEANQRPRQVTQRSN